MPKLNSSSALASKSQAECQQFRGHPASPAKVTVSFPCPSCGSSETQSIFETTRVPVSCGTLWPSRTAAQRCVTGHIHLKACPACGLVFNSAFDAELVEYNTNYENALDFSPAFQTYLQSLVDRLVTQYNLFGKSIVEIGCGNGSFLTKLCACGANSGLGYDPSFSGDPAPAENVRFVNGYFGEADTSRKVDFICCRHVLEHIENPLRFLTTLRQILSSRSHAAKLYVEVPNGVNVLAGDGRWDVIYPHVSYFTQASLCYLLNRAGFTVLASGTTFGEQFLFVEASIKPAVAETLETLSSRFGNTKPSLATKIYSFSEHFDASLLEWSQCLDSFTSSQKRIAFWGAGSRGVTFLNFVPGARNIGAVVDVNPRKQGMFVAGTGQTIISPEALAHYSPEAVIVLNSAYRAEISAHLKGIGLPAVQIITSPV
jgi:SAM-dependent methyltransferase